MKQYVKVRSPASIGNFGPGFDTFGMCLEEPADIIEIWWGGEADAVECDHPEVPTEPARNSGAYAARAVLNYFDMNRNFIVFCFVSANLCN